MRNEKKLMYLQKQNADLIKQIDELKKENFALTSQFEVNKTTILSKEKLLDEKIVLSEEAKRNYDAIVLELQKVKEKYQIAVEEAIEAKERYISKTIQKLKQINHKK